MDIQASAKFIRISPKKVSALLVPLRGMKTSEALTYLKFHRSKAARLVHKLVHSAVSNAKNNYNFKADNLKIKYLTVDGGPSYKRYWFRSRGGADKLIKRTSHLQVTLTEIKPSLVKKPVAQPAPSKPPPDRPIHTETPQRPQSAPIAEAPKPKSGALKRIFTRRTTNK